MRPVHLYSFSLITLLTALSLGSPAIAQETLEWQRMRPAPEEFAIEMPKDATSDAATFAYHKMELNARLYISLGKPGPVFAVVSLGGIKSNPAAYSEMERLNSYVDAFRNWFPTRVRPKETVAKLTLAGNKLLNGHNGREYKVTIADLSGVADVYATKKRFYAVVFLNTKPDDSLRDKFLSTFFLPDNFAAAPTVAAQNPPAPEDAGRNQAPAQAEGEAANAPKPEAENPEGEGAPIKGGVLNGRALSLPKPDHPYEAGQTSGTVVVRVLIDEEGNVIEANAVSGPQEFYQAAVNAARLAKFSPTRLMGKPVKVNGTISYNFGR